MTLKYESELLFDLMKRDGDVAPSDVLPYESELKEKYLNQVVGAYPKLQDYQPEWLYYNLYHHIPSDFPVESVANVTSASFNNVVPYAYKSAILKGQTLVNLVNNSNEEKEIGEGNTTPAKYKYIYPLTNSKEYTVQFEIVDFNADKAISFSINNGSQGVSTTALINKNGIYKFKTTLNTDNASEIWIYWSFGNYNSEYTGKVKNIVVLDGDYTNIDIPYFEGMTSVKMPVLIATGKNLFDITKHNNLIINDNGEYISTKYYGEATPVKYSLKKNTTYSVSYVKNGTFSMSVNGVWVNTNGSSAKFTTDDRGEYIIKIGSESYINNNKKIWDNIQIEEGSVATEYEPYKSNILTVNEDVTLRSNGSVHDELDLLTGKLTQRIDENGEVLSQEIVKTVDLSCINEQGESEAFRPIEGTMHVNTSSQTLPAFLDMSVPVEATTQNLMSFANIEGEE